MPAIENIPQAGDSKNLEDAKSAMPISGAPTQGAMPPSSPQPMPPSVAPTQGQAAPAPSMPPGFPTPPSENDFQSPFPNDIPYEKALALYLSTIGANIATADNAHPDLKELYWALQKDLGDKINLNKAANPDSTVKPGDPNPAKDKPAVDKSGTDKSKEQPSSEDMITLLKEIRDRLPNGTKP